MTGLNCTDSGGLAVKGMRYNPNTYKWEGNEASVTAFDAATPKSPKVAPALITNGGARQNVQVVGGMVFDPRRMSWLKLAPVQADGRELTTVQDEDDVFAGLNDLEEKAPQAENINDDHGLVGSGDDPSGEESSDEWPITEEFDVGPEFVKRQRMEEEKWRRKVNKWVGSGGVGLGDGWRWAIRDLVGSHNGAVATTPGMG